MSNQVQKILKFKINTSDKQFDEFSAEQFHEISIVYFQAEPKKLLNGSVSKKI